MSSTVLAVIYCSKKKMVVEIHLRCFWHWECMRSTGKYSLLSKGCTSFPQLIEYSYLTSRVREGSLLPLFDLSLIKGEGQ